MTNEIVSQKITLVFNINIKAPPEILEHTIKRLKTETGAAMVGDSLADAIWEEMLEKVRDEFYDDFCKMVTVETVSLDLLPLKEA